MIEPTDLRLVPGQHLTAEVFAATQEAIRREKASLAARQGWLFAQVRDFFRRWCELSGTPLLRGATGWSVELPESGLEKGAGGDPGPQARLHIWQDPDGRGEDVGGHDFPLSWLFLPPEELEKTIHTDLAEQRRVEASVAEEQREARIRAIREELARLEASGRPAP